MDPEAVKSGKFTLHRYYLWANRKRTHLDEKLPAFGEQLSTNPNVWTDEGIESFMYMSYWYAGLYVVVEGWRELALSDPAVDALLSETEKVELLKKYRHGVYHFQKDYFDHRFMDFVAGGNDIVVWVRTLNQAFGGYFLNRPLPLLAS